MAVVVLGVPVQAETDTTGPVSTLMKRPLEGHQAFAQFGFAVSVAGDINGDGYHDLIVGANGFDNIQPDEGRILVYYGSVSGIRGIPDWTAESNKPYAMMGTSLAVAGDVNSDGFDDIISGVPHHDRAKGRVLAYYGSASGIGREPDWVVDGDQEGARFGHSVATAGDVNGDQYDDVIVGAPYRDDSTGDEGSVFVYFGSGTGLNSANCWTASGNQANEYFGFAVASAGDVDGDSKDEIVVGAIGYGHEQHNAWYP